MMRACRLGQSVLIKCLLLKFSHHLPLHPRHAWGCFLTLGPFLAQGWALQGLVWVTHLVVRGDQGTGDLAKACKLSVLGSTLLSPAQPGSLVILQAPQAPLWPAAFRSSHQALGPAGASVSLRADGGGNLSHFPAGLTHLPLLAESGVMGAAD